MKKLMLILLILMLGTLLWGQTHIKINSGGPSLAGGWESDSAYVSGGSSYTFGGTHDTSGVTDPAPNEVYQKVRHYNHTYSIPVADGDYLVRIHFTEGYADPSGNRKMRYTIEGQVVLDNFNIYSAAGNSTYKAVIREFNTTVNDGVLTINCEKASGNDVFEAGVEVILDSGIEYEMNVKTIQFNHDTTSNSHDALNIRFDWYTNIPLPEWNYDQMLANPAAYAVDDMNQPVTIKVKFALNTQNSVTLPVRGISSESSGNSVLGTTNTMNVTFTSGYSSVTDFSVPFEVSKQVRKGDDTWTWKAYVNGAWTDMDSTDHTIYLLWDKPRGPWKMEYGHKQNPWTDALDFAIESSYCNTNGLDSIETIASQITEYLFENNTYDTVSGNPHYSNKLGFFLDGEAAWIWNQNLDLNRYMNQRDTTVNCSDQAAALETLASLLGIDAKTVRTQRKFGYINATYITGVEGLCNNPFFNKNSTNPLVGENETKDRSYFDYHAFVLINNGIYDATAGPETGDKTLKQYLDATIDRLPEGGAEEKEAVYCEYDYPPMGFSINIGVYKILLINCGGPIIYADMNRKGWKRKDIWKAGEDFSPGGTSVSFGGEHFIDPDIEDPAGQEVYQTAQKGNQQENLQYSFPDILDGRYDVRLHFSDGEENAYFKRMRFKINNEIPDELDNFCIADEAGGFSKVIIKDFSINVEDGNGITIECEDLNGEGVLINGIEIRSVNPGLVNRQDPEEELIYYDRTVSLAPDSPSDSQLYSLLVQIGDKGYILPDRYDIDYPVWLSEYSDPLPIVATPDEGDKFVQWYTDPPEAIDGIVDKYSPVTYISIKDNVTLWAEFARNCGSSQQIAPDFVQEGVGEYCFEASSLGNYINSWELETLTVNGVDLTNRGVSSSDLPEKINGKYEIYYKSLYPWGHFEAKY